MDAGRGSSFEPPVEASSSEPRAAPSVTLEQRSLSAADFCFDPIVSSEPANARTGTYSGTRVARSSPGALVTIGADLWHVLEVVDQGVDLERTHVGVGDAVAVSPPPPEEALDPEVGFERLGLK